MMRNMIAPNPCFQRYHARNGAELVLLFGNLVTNSSAPAHLAGINQHHEAKFVRQFKTRRDRTNPGGLRAARWNDPRMG